MPYSTSDDIKPILVPDLPWLRYVRIGTEPTDWIYQNGIWYSHARYYGLDHPQGVGYARD